MKFKMLKVLALLIATTAMISCENVGDNDPTSGTLKIYLTDAPFPTDMVAEANVTITKIDVRKENDDEENPFIILSEEEMSFNLLELANGVIANLVDIDLDSGLYDLVRLHVSEASIMLKDSTVYDLFVPSGAQTGIKIFIDPAIEVAGGLTSELMLDFNVSKSFVVQGNPITPAGITGFIFKPVIKASNLTTAGRLAGMVTDTSDVVIDGVEVSMWTADTVYTTSFTDSTGAYMFLGVDAGTYDVAFAKDGFLGTDFEDIEITAGNLTTVNAQLTPEEETEE
ncbi:MAG: DUF4382 domain-containing protein [Bacteroidales bacterium]